jgi:hypothetical protein
MPRAFPTQIVGYLSKTFGKPASFDYAIIQSHVGAVAGFLELYDQLPAELIRRRMTTPRSLPRSRRCGMALTSSGEAIVPIV